MTRRLLSSLPVASLAAAVLAGSLAGCAPLLIGAAAGTAMMASDRRTSGAQIDDEAIELRAASRLSEAMGGRVHIAVASYNRQVLLTGETSTEKLREQAEQIVGRVDNVRGVVNELVVATPTTLPQRSGDVLITGKVRASYVDAADLQANAIRVVTERGVVYLMGRVTQREADRATSIARQIGGVHKVVRVFEIVTPEELQQASLLAPTTPAGATVAPAAAPAPAPAAAPAPPPEPAGAVTSPVR